MVNEIQSYFRALKIEDDSPNPGAMAGSASYFCVTDVVSRGVETHHTFGVPKRLALKALQKAFVRAEAFESSKVTVLERLPVSAYWSFFGYGYDSNGTSLGIAKCSGISLFQRWGFKHFSHDPLWYYIYPSSTNRHAAMQAQSVAAAGWPNHGKTLGESCHLRSAPRKLDSSFKEPLS